MYKSPSYPDAVFYKLANVPKLSVAMSPASWATIALVCVIEPLWSLHLREFRTDGGCAHTRFCPVTKDSFIEFVASDGRAQLKISANNDLFSSQVVDFSGSASFTKFMHGFVSQLKITANKLVCPQTPPDLIILLIDALYSGLTSD